MPHRICVVGTSGYATEHIAAVRRLVATGTAELVGPVDGLEAYREILESGPAACDLVVLPLPIPLHAEQGIPALDRGFRVLTEKPLAGSSAEAVAFLAAADGRLDVGYQHAYASTGRGLYEHAGSRKLGELREVTAFGAWPRSQAYYSRNEWAGRITHGDRSILDSPMQSAFAHVVHLALLALEAAGHVGMPTPRFVFQSKVNEIDGPDTQVVEAVASNGARCRLAFTHATDRQIDPELVFRFERGRLRWHMHSGLVALEARFGDEIEDCRTDPLIGRTERMYRSILDPGDASYRSAILSASVEHVRFVETVLSHPITTVPQRLWRQDVVRVGYTGPDPNSPVRHVPNILGALRNWFATGDPATLKTHLAEV